MISLLLIASLRVHALTFSVPALEENWSSVVQITTEGLDSEHEIVNSYCVATFLNPQTLVTAAHCVSHAFLLSSSKVKIEIGQYEYRSRPDGTIFRLGYIVKNTYHTRAQFYFNINLTQKLRSQKYRTLILPEEDLAIIKLENPVVNEINYFKPMLDSEMKAIKKVIHNYNPTVVTVNLFSEMSLDTKRVANLNHFKSSSSRSWKSNSQSRVEPGDSGAPLFIQLGQGWKLMGVVKGRAKNLFSDWDVFSSFESNLCEISKANSLSICD